MPARKTNHTCFFEQYMNNWNVGAGLCARPQNQTGMNNLPQRKQIRLKYYDYALAGYYFVTICTHNKQKILCSIDLPAPGDNTLAIKYTKIGLKVEQSILNVPAIFSGVYIDQYIIMPNHLHLIVVLTNTGGHGDPPLHDIIGRFKSFTTREYNLINRTKGRFLWQRNYYEHVIRDEDELNSIRQYILYNPANWQEDKYYTI